MTATREGTGNGTVPAWHAGFLMMMPVIRRSASALFQHLSGQARDEALAEVVAVAMMGYLRHLEETQMESFDSAAFARRAALHVLASGRACGRESSRDVLSPIAQQQRGFRVEHLKQSCDAVRLRMRIDLRMENSELSPIPSQPPRTNGNKGDLSVRFAHERSRRHKAENRLHSADIELEAARRIQQKLFPTASPALPGFDIAGMAWPAAATGGDYFDYLPMLDECTGVVVGDVSGHGFGPALLMASTRAYLRAFAQTHSDLGELLSLVNRVLALDMEGDHFVTLVLARLDPRKRSLVYASAGHPTGYILNASGHVRLFLPSTGPLLGLESEGSFSSSLVIPLEPGDFVVLLTDGVIEAEAPDGTAFGWTRAVNLVRFYRDDSAARIIDNLCHAVRAFCQNEPQLDDITAVVIKVDGNARGDQS